MKSMATEGEVTAEAMTSDNGSSAYKAKGLPWWLSQRGAQPGAARRGQATPEKSQVWNMPKMTDEPKVPLAPSSQGLFNTAMGPLQRQLREGEYNLFKWASMFESDFVQVSKRGGALDVHNQVRQVRVAIAATSPGLKVPNVLLLARTVLPEQSSRQARLRHMPPNVRFELTRLLPLCFIKISIHDLEKKQLRFKMATGRTFYLQLCPPLDNQPDNFESWVKVIHLLRPPSKFSQESKELDLQSSWNALAIPSSGESILHTPVDPLDPTLRDGECNILDTLSTVPEESQGHVNLSGSWDSPYPVLDSAIALPHTSAISRPPTPAISRPPTPTISRRPTSSPSVERELESETPPPSEGETGKSKPKPSLEEPKTERPRDRPVPTRRSSSQNKPTKPRRSHSTKRVVSRSPSKISTLFMSSFSSRRRHHKGTAKKSKEKQR